MSLAPADPWRALRRFTPARIALGRAGVSLPTAELLRFGLAHARARDAIHRPLDYGAVAAALERRGLRTLRVRSRAADRRTYLLRPDLGRQLDPACVPVLEAQAGAPDLACVVADGLSAAAVAAHAVPLLASLHALLPAAQRHAPVVIAEQGRVALGDEIGALLGARLTLVLLGERPGLSAPDSLGAYLTFEARPGRTDAERNCVSNIRPEGLSYAAAAARIAWLLEAAARLGISGVPLKDGSEPSPPPALKAGGGSVIER